MVLVINQQLPFRSSKRVFLWGGRTTTPAACATQPLQRQGTDAATPQRSNASEGTRGEKRTAGFIVIVLSRGLFRILNFTVGFVLLL